MRMITKLDLLLLCNVLLVWTLFMLEVGARTNY
jgi:hypothetical protein